MFCLLSPIHPSGGWARLLFLSWAPGDQWSLMGERRGGSSSTVYLYIYSSGFLSGRATSSWTIDDHSWTWWLLSFVVTCQGKDEHTAWTPVDRYSLLSLVMSGKEMLINDNKISIKSYFTEKKLHSKKTLICSESFMSNLVDIHLKNAMQRLQVFCHF